MVTLKEIDKKYDDNIILEDLSIHVEKGEFITITGESGVGKSTLLNILGFIDKPDKGTIKMAGYTNPDKKEIVLLRREVIGYIFQNYLLMNHQTVYQNLLLSKMYNKNFNNSRVDKVIQDVGLRKEDLQKKISQLSGGEQQRVAIARMMLKQFKIILADEPTGNLDEKNTIKIIELFKKMKSQGKTIICVTHNELMAESSDRKILMNMRR